MKDNKFQFHVGQMWLKEPLSIDEILEKLGVTSHFIMTNPPHVRLISS